MAYKEQKRKLILFLLTMTAIFLFSMMNVSALNWQTPPKSVNATNLTDVNNYLTYLNETKYPNGSQIPTNIVNQTTGSNWVGMTLDAILDLIYQMLGYNQNLTLSVNQTLTNQIQSLQLNLTNMSKVKVYYDYINITTSGGLGSIQTSDKVGFEITRITVTSLNPSTKFRFLAKEATSGTIIDQDRALHIGTWDIYKSHVINNDYVYLGLNSANPDDTFQVKLTYIDNFRP